jgi:acyl carrier protein
VGRVLARVLRLSAGDLDPAAPFTDFGLDSIGGVAFIGELNRELALDLRPMVLFDHGSVARLAAHLATLGVTASLPASAAAPAAPSPEPALPSCALASSAVPAPSAPTAASGPVAAGDIAVIGFAGRFPGAADPAAFWEILRTGGDAITEVPPDRWDHARFHAAEPAGPDRTPFKWGGFMPDADRFDPVFFGISGREAEAMDPQQRVFLEACYHALEDAGYAGPSVRLARHCGVFAGVEPGDDLQLCTDATPEGRAPLFQGNAESILAARISYFLDLSGPSLAVNTACSSSLVAIHLACRSLQQGDCALALAGGVRVFASE